MASACTRLRAWLQSDSIQKELRMRAARRCHALLSPCHARRARSSGREKAPNRQRHSSWTALSGDATRAVTHAHVLCDAAIAAGPAASLGSERKHYSSARHGSDGLTIAAHDSVVGGGASRVLAGPERHSPALTTRTLVGGPQQTPHTRSGKRARKAAYCTARACLPRRRRLGLP
jgi:hypothetical protein